MTGSDPKEIARDLLSQAHPALIGLSHWIHANPELGYQEVLAAGWVADWMAAAGFEVRRNVAGMETAVAASYGSGPFHVALCAEYDALPGVGHACGHNVIAAASVGAAVALAAVSDVLGLRVTLLGTPAEEGGGGKVFLIEAGEFQGVHAALMVHPGPEDIVEPEILGVRTLNVSYTGREAHAAGFPELGVNAADALTVAQVAIAALRQHIEPGDRIHGIVTRGGDAPNIVPAHTTASYMVRSRTRAGLDALTERVARCFEAGAIATGSAVTVTQEMAYAPMRHDPDLGALYRANAESIGRWFDPAARMVVSTDMGDVSHVLPSIHPMIGIDSRPAVNHQPEFTTAAALPAADQAIFDGALLLAYTVIDAARNLPLRERLTGEAWTPPRRRARSASGSPAAAMAQAVEAASADEYASEAERIDAENAAEVAWAASEPRTAPWEGENTADDTDAGAGAADDTDAVARAAAGEEAVVLTVEETVWEADFAAALQSLDLAAASDNGAGESKGSNGTEEAAAASAHEGSTAER
jgi:amidohydrolase